MQSAAPEVVWWTGRVIAGTALHCTQVLAAAQSHILPEHRVRRVGPLRLAGRRHAKVRVEADLESGNENEPVRIAAENGLDSVIRRKARVQLQLLVAEKRSRAAREIYKTTQGRWRAAVLLTLAAFIMAPGTSGH